MNILAASPATGLLPWGRIVVLSVIVLQFAGIAVLWEARGKALAEAGLQKARAAELQSAYDQVVAATKEQNTAVEALRKAGDAAAVKVQEGQASGAKARERAEDQAARLRSLKPSADPAQDQERIRAVLSAMGSEWRVGR